MTHALNILVVDDDLDNAASLGELFEMEGHAVSVVHSGQAAIDSYLNRNFDLAFMDVMMPGKNGLDSFLEIRRLKPTARVYMMSGYSVEELMIQALAGGALGFLDKPFEPTEVIRLTERVGNGGMVLTASTERNAAHAIEHALLQNGRACSVIGTRGEASTIADPDGVVVINADLHLIDEVAVFHDLRLQGHEGPTILVPHIPPELTNHSLLLHDVGVTGILNKPFDPLELLQRLQQLAA